MQFAWWWWLQQQSSSVAHAWAMVISVIIAETSNLRIRTINKNKHFNLDTHYSPFCGCHISLNARSAEFVWASMGGSRQLCCQISTKDLDWTQMSRWWGGARRYHERRVGACNVGNMQWEVMDTEEFRIPHSENAGSMVGVRYNSTWRNGCAKLCWPSKVWRTSWCALRAQRYVKWCR